MDEAAEELYLTQQIPWDISELPVLKGDDYEKDDMDMIRAVAIQTGAWQAVATPVAYNYSQLFAGADGADCTPHLKAIAHLVGEKIWQRLNGQGATSGQTFVPWALRQILACAVMQLDQSMKAAQADAPKNQQAAATLKKIQVKKREKVKGPAKPRQ